MTKILLVEDDKSLREIYGVRLLAEGYDIVSAGDGEEALALAIKERPELIISDVMMPKISGFDMLDILRSTTETKTIKVIMMTALSSDDQRRRGEQLGADKYLVKSQVGIEDVVRTVHEVLGDAPVAPAGNQNPFDAAKAAPAAPASAPQPGTPSLPTPQPQATAPAPQQQPSAPYQTASTQTPAAPAGNTEPNSAMPQPTAPFSSSSPRPANLGERVIQPLDKPQTDGPDVSEMINRELSGEETMPTPFETPMTGEAHTDASKPTPTPQPEPTPAPAPQPAPTPAPAMPEPSAPPAAPNPQQPPAMPSPSPQPAPAAPQTPAQPADQSQASGPIKYEETPLPQPSTPASQPPTPPQAPQTQPPAQPGA